MKLQFGETGLLTFMLTLMRQYVMLREIRIPRAIILMRYQLRKTYGQLIPFMMKGIQLFTGQQEVRLLELTGAS